MQSLSSSPTSPLPAPKEGFVRYCLFDAPVAHHSLPPFLRLLSQRRSMVPLDGHVGEAAGAATFHPRRGGGVCRKVSDDCRRIGGDQQGHNVPLLFTRGAEKKRKERRRGSSFQDPPTSRERGEELKILPTPTSRNFNHEKGDHYTTERRGGKQSGKGKERERGSGKVLRC